MSNDRACKNCGSIWRRFVYTDCDCLPSEYCIDRLISPDDPKHCEIVDVEGATEEVVAYQCVHGIDYDIKCTGCGEAVSSWGYGMAGYGDCGGDGTCCGDGTTVP